MEAEAEVVVEMAPYVPSATDATEATGPADAPVEVEAGVEAVAAAGVEADMLRCEVARLQAQLTPTLTLDP